MDVDQLMTFARSARPTTCIVVPQATASVAVATANTHFSRRLSRLLRSCALALAGPCRRSPDSLHSRRAGSTSPTTMHHVGTTSLDGSGCSRYHRVPPIGVAMPGFLGSPRALYPVVIRYPNSPTGARRVVSLIMRAELVQRRGVLRRTYTLVDNGIRVSERSLSSGRSLTIPYEVLFGDREEVFTASKGALWTMLVTTVLAVFVVFAESEPYAWLFWGTFAVIAGVYFWMSRRDQLGFSDGTASLFFLRDNPSAAAVEEFLAGARKRARDRIRSRLVPLRPTDDARADLLRAEWLREKGFITEVEFSTFKRELDPMRLQAPPDDTAPN